MLSVNGPYEIIDESHIDNHLLIDHLLGENPLNSMIPYLSNRLLLNISSTWTQGRNLSCLKEARGFYKGKGSWFITWRNVNTYIMDHIAKRKRTRIGGVTYLWRTTIDEQKKKLDMGSTWAPHFPLMSKGERMLEWKEYCHQWQRGRLLIKVVIDVNMILQGWKIFLWCMTNSFFLWCFPNLMQP